MPDAQREPLRSRAVAAGPAGQRALRRRLRDRLDAARPSTPAPGVSLAVVEVNPTTTPHPEGRDRLLTALGARLVDITRPSDLVVRTSAGGFVLVLDGARSPHALATARRRIADALSRPVLVDNRPVRPGFRVGLLAAGPDDTVEALLGRVSALATRDGRDARRVRAIRTLLPL